MHSLNRMMLVTSKVVHLIREAVHPISEALDPISEALQQTSEALQVISKPRLRLARRGVRAREPRDQPRKRGMRQALDEKRQAGVYKI